MLRSLLISLSKAEWARKIMMSWRLARRAASRFIAGTTIQEAFAVIAKLQSQGLGVTLDHLGEHTSTPAEAAGATDELIAVLEALKHNNVRANLSLKLTQIGLALDESLCRENLRRVVMAAAAQNCFVRVDMEDTPYTDQTLRMIGTLLAGGIRNCGVVLQSYLYRSEQDLRACLDAGMRVRLVKGAYQESRDRAFAKKADVDANFDLLTKIMLDHQRQLSRVTRDVQPGWPPIPAIATHDEQRIEFARRYAESIGLPKRDFEFQMLYGIRRDLQAGLTAAGYQVRIYVPFGTHWYPYFMRRLAERPANLWFMISNLLR